jgi:dTDP-4-amino-4,6-dideoxygalactose transaminase
MAGATVMSAPASASTPGLTRSRPRLADDNARRRAIAARYDDGLIGLPLALPRQRADSYHVFHQYVVRSKRRDQLREHLRRGQIGTGVHYPVPVHLQPAYRGRLGEFPAGLPETTRIAGEILSLPIYPQLAGEAADRVVSEIRHFFE